MIKHSWVLGGLLFGAGLAYFFWQSSLWIHAAEMFDRELKPIGYQQEAVPGPLYLEPDSYLWMTYARRIAEGETWRVRWTMTDNPPEGRAVHWSQSISWILVAAGNMRSWLLPGDSLQTDLEKASVWINAACFLLLCLGVLGSMSRSLGFWVGGAAVLMLSSLGDVLWAFHALRPDHQTLHALFGFGTLLFAWAGGLGFSANGPDSPRVWVSSRHWFWASALCAGAGLWVSATAQSFFIVALAATSGIWLVLRSACVEASEEADRNAAALWLEWGLVTAGLSLAFYALEYAPNFPWSRLEVNHPLYAVCAGALGLGMATAIRLRSRSNGTALALSWIVVVVASVVVLLPLALLLKGPEQLHTVRSVEMLRFHNFIKEFYLYWNFIKTGTVAHFCRSFGVLLLAVPTAGWLVWRIRKDTATLAWLSGLLFTTMGFLALGLFQLRWISFFAMSLVLLTATVLAVLWRQRSGSFSRFAVGVGIFLLMGQTAYLMKTQSHEIRLMLSGRTVITDLLSSAYIKYVAVSLGRAEPSPRAILADPNYAPAIAYFAGIPTVVSFYWENLEGLRTARDVWASEDWDEAHRILARKGISHILMEPSDYLPNVFYFIKHGRYDLQASQNTLSDRILYEKGPSWIQIDQALIHKISGRFSYRTDTLEHHMLIFKVLPSNEAISTSPPPDEAASAAPRSRPE